VLELVLELALRLRPRQEVSQGVVWVLLRAYVQIAGLRWFNLHVLDYFIDERALLFRGQSDGEVLELPLWWSAKQDGKIALVLLDGP